MCFGRGDNIVNRRKGGRGSKGKGGKERPGKGVTVSNIPGTTLGFLKASARNLQVLYTNMIFVGNSAVAQRKQGLHSPVRRSFG